MISEGSDFDDTTPAVKYNLDDHLGSSNVLVDENGTLVNFEEYYPFGETSFGSYAKKRYRFCGKEKDEESGMYYYGARYYSPWLCRFINVDPLAGKYPFYTAYQYAGNQPINFIDLDGLEQAPAQTPAGGAAAPKPAVNNVNQQDGTATDMHAGKAPDSSTLRLNTSTDSSNTTLSRKPENIESKKIIKQDSAKTNINPFIRKHLDNIIKSEAGYVDNPADPGGKTKYGIAENREWKAAAKYLKIDSNPENIKNLTQEQAEKYYLHTRFEKFRITDIKSEKVANAISDQSIITPGIINKNLKRALNEMGYNFEVNSTKLTDEQIAAVNAVNSDVLVKNFTEKQRQHYESIKQSNPVNYQKHIDGWINRLERLNNYKP